VSTALGLILTGTLAQMQLNVQLLPIRGDRTTDLQLVAANDQFVWFRVATEVTPLGGGAGLFRFDRDGGAVRTVAALSELTPSTTADSFPAPQPWGPDGFLVAEGALSRADARRRWGRTVTAANETMALLVEQDRGWWWEPGREPTGLPFAPGDAVALPDGRLAVDARLRDGGSGVFVASSDGGSTFLRDRHLVGRIDATLVLRSNEEVFTEYGLRLGDWAPFQGRQRGQRRVIGQTRDGGLWLFDGTSMTSRRLLTAAAGVVVLETVVGEQLVAFVTRDGGFMVERLSDGARFATPGAPAERPRFEWGRVVFRSVGLEVLDDGGLSPLRQPGECEWKRLRESNPEEFCIMNGQLRWRPSRGAPEMLLPGDLTQAAPVAGWLAERRFNLDRGLLFSNGSSSHWTDGTSSYSLATGERLLQEVGDRLLVARDGFTLIDPSTNAQEALGLPVAVRPLRASRSLFFQFPGCRVRWYSPRRELIELSSDRCVDEVAETPRGTLLLGPSGHAWVDWWRPAVQPVRVEAMPRPEGMQRALAFLGDTVWTTWSSGTIVPIDAASGRTSTPINVGSSSVNRAGVLGFSMGWRWFSFDGGGWPFGVDRSGPFVALGTDVAWLISDSAVHVTTGGEPIVVPAVDAGAWRLARAVGHSLVSPTERSLEVLETDGTVRRVEVDVFDPTFAVQSDDQLWFAGFDETHGVELWAFDGTGARLVADLVPGPNSSYPRFIGRVPQGVIVQAGRADGTIGAVAVLFNSPDPPSTETRAFAGGGCEATPMLELVGILALLRQRRRRGR
jgi:ELWxxDGT repeat protein